MPFSPGVWRQGSSNATTFLSAITSASLIEIVLLMLNISLDGIYSLFPHHLLSRVEWQDEKNLMSEDGREFLQTL